MSTEIFSDPITYNNPDFDGFKAGVPKELSSGFLIEDVLNAPPYEALQVDESPDERKIVSDHEQFHKLLYLEDLLRLDEATFKEVVTSEIGRPELTREDVLAEFNPEKLEQYRATVKLYDQSTGTYARRPFDPRSDYQKTQERKHPVKRYMGPGGEKAQGWGMDKPAGAPVSEWLHGEREDLKGELFHAGVTEENLDNYYDMEAPFSERWDTISDFWNSDEEISGITPNSSWRVQRWVSPYNLSVREFRNIIRNSDPTADVKYINPKLPEEGLLVRSPKTDNQWVPLDPVSVVEQPSLAPMTDSFINFIGQDFLPILMEGGGVTLLTRKLITDASKRIDDLAQKGHEGAIEAGTKAPFLKRFGKKTAEISGYAALAGPMGAFGRLGHLAYGVEAGIQPDLTFDRAMEDAQLAAVMGAAGTLGGEIILRTASNLWRTATGKNIPQHMIDRVRVRAKQWKDKFDGVADEPLEELTQEQLKEGAEQMGSTAGESYREALRGEEHRTFANMTNDDILQEIETDLMALLPSWNPDRAAVEQMFDKESGMLRDYWESLSRSAGDDVRVHLPSYKEVEEHFDSIRKAALQEEIRIGEEALVETKAAADIAGQTVTKMERDEAAEILGAQTRTSEIFPDYRNESFIQQDNAIRNARQKVDEILNQEEYISLGTKQIAKYIGEPLRKLLTGDTKDAFIQTSEAYLAARDLRNQIPMGEGGESVIKQLVEIKPQDAHGFIKKMEFNIPQIVASRENFAAMFRNHPNKELREIGDEVIQGLDKAIADLLDEGYKNQTGKSALPANTSARREVFGRDLIDSFDNYEEVLNRVDGKYLYSVVSGEPEKIADTILTGSPRQIREVLDLISEEANGVDKTVAMQNLVLDHIRRTVKDEDTLKENKQFQAYLEKYGDQLEALFPDRGLEKFKTFERFQNQAGKEIKLNEKRIVALREELGGETSLPNFIQEFLNAGAAQKSAFEESAIKKKMENLSALADEFPELRRGMLSIFQTWMRNRVQGSDYPALGTRAMRSLGSDKGFNLGALKELVLTPYAPGQEGTATFAKQLSLILGKEAGSKYAKNLRTFALRVNRLNDREWARTNDLINQGQPRQMIDYIDQSLSDPQRVVTGQISKASRRITVARQKITALTRAHLLKLVTDPEAIDVLVNNFNRQMHLRDFGRIIANLAGLHWASWGDPGSEIGLEDKEALRSYIRGKTETIREDPLGAVKEGTNRIEEMLSGNDEPIAGEL